MERHARAWLCSPRARRPVPMGSRPLSWRASPGSVPNRRVGKGLHGREMKIGFCQRRDIRRSAESRQPLAALDPAHFVAELSRDPDVVVLALRNMQDIGLLIAEG